MDFFAGINSCFLELYMGCEPSEDVDRSWLSWFGVAKTVDCIKRWEIGQLNCKFNNQIK